jgi:hypothetical protein
MTARRHWSDLSERNRKLLLAAAVAEGILKIAALIDIKRRPASQIRGRKWMWAAVVAVANSAGAAPISCLSSGGVGILIPSLIHVRVPPSITGCTGCPRTLSRHGAQHDQPWTVILHPQKRKLESSSSVGPPSPSADISAQLGTTWGPHALPSRTQSAGRRTSRFVG